MFKAGPILVISSSWYLRFGIFWGFSAAARREKKKGFVLQINLLMLQKQKSQ
jgi:hypothetical protein